MESFRFLSAREALKGILFILCIYGTTDYAQGEGNVNLYKKLAGRNHIYFTQLSSYLTIMTLSLSYFVKYLGISSALEIYKDSLSITLPMEGLVTTIFWIFNSIDPALLKNKELCLEGIKTPIIGELSLHMLPLVLLLIDQIGVDVHEKKRHYWIFGIAAVLYFMTTYYCQSLNGFWVYPFLDDVSMALRIVFFGLLTFLVVVYYKLFLKLSQLINYRIPEKPRI